MKNIQKLLTVARGDEPADLVIAGGKVFNSFTGNFESRDIIVTDGYIAALVPCGDALSASARERKDVKGQWVVPGFIDAHVHIESSMVCPEEFCELLVRQGVTTVIADPHEIANVLGTRGIEYMLRATEQTVARVFFMLPSCVPASPLGSAAWTLEAKDLQVFLGHPRVLGLGEVMNVPGVLQSMPDVLAKMHVVQQYNDEHFAGLRGLAMDGHAPMLEGLPLQAYAASGITSDHEASTVKEAEERLAAGMGLMLREGSAARNLLDLVPAVTEYTAHLCMLCTDDRHPEDIEEQGSINYLVRQLVQDGRLPLPTILNMASYNTARHFSLRDTGAIAPGYRADCAVYADLDGWKPLHVWSRGRQVVDGGRGVAGSDRVDTAALRGRVVLSGDVTPERLRVADTGRRVKVIGIIPGQLTTSNEFAGLPAVDGFLRADAEQDIAKLAVFERHLGSGRVAVSFLRGLGMRRGALASTVAHDAHNLVVAGMNDSDMFMAVQTLQKTGGGLAVVCDGRVLAQVALPLAGIFSDRPVGEVCRDMRAIKAVVRELGVEGSDPFMTLAFMTLDVIPSLKLTDSGLVDVDTFAFTSLYEE